MKIIRALIIALGALVLQCAHTADCTERIDICLKNCPPPEPAATLPSDRGDGQGHERRTDCERRCHGMCSSSAQLVNPTPINPAQGPLDPGER